jgi:polyferredoxin
MRGVTARRISQGFFLALFFWFCVVSSVGIAFWQLRGWPVNWFLQLDPLVALATALTTRVLPAGLWWALVTVTVTLVLGRVFCGWLCPFGTMQQIVGWLGRRGKSVKERIELNRYRSAQGIKYLILAALLAAAAAGLLQTGLLDPIPLAQRSISLAVLAIVDVPAGALSVEPRYYEGGALIGAVFLAFLLLSLVIPRFFCRFACPLGALLGLLSRFSLWRIGKSTPECTNCRLCDRDCEGACSPGGGIRTGECLVCMNCLDGCSIHDLMRYDTDPPAGGVIEGSDTGRRAFLTAVFAGVATVPLIRLTGRSGANWNPGLIRPPGSLTEDDFLGLCLKCGQCMRVCPTNVLQPLALRAGPEALWTPALNNRVGTSGCQLNCVACGNVCPTGAIRPLALDEKLGKGAFKDAGPVRIGTAFMDHGRCLPWAMDRPCIVCEENCPVTPKAIYLEEEFRTVSGGNLVVARTTAGSLSLKEPGLSPDRFATGDYYCAIPGSGPVRRITGNTDQEIVLDPATRWTRRPPAGATVAIQVRLQKPRVDPEKCIGCGVCEHECVVNGLRAIRVSAENETRGPEHSLTVKTRA